MSVSFFNRGLDECFFLYQAAKVYAELSQTFKMDLSTKLINGGKPSFVKSSILVFWPRSEYTTLFLKETSKKFIRNEVIIL